MRSLIVCLALASGCDAQVIPGNGQLAVIDADDAFASSGMDGGDQSLRELDAVRAGAHYWNSLGANLKMADELTADEWAANPPHFGLHRDTFSWPGEGRDAPSGVEWSDLGYATIYVSVLRAGGNHNYAGLREDVAHELGHAIGLAHLSSATVGTMAADSNWWGDQPDQADRDQYCALYPGCSKQRGGE